MKFYYFIIQAFLFLILQFLFIVLFSKGGGALNMMFILGLYATAIQMMVMSIGYLIGAYIFKYKELYFWIPISALVFELSIVFMMQDTSLIGLFDTDEDGLAKRSLFFPNVIATISTLFIASWLNKKS